MSGCFFWNTVYMWSSFRWKTWGPWYFGGPGLCPPSSHVRIASGLCLLLINKTKRTAHRVYVPIRQWCTSCCRWRRRAVGRSVWYCACTGRPRRDGTEPCRYQWCCDCSAHARSPPPRRWSSRFLLLPPDCALPTPRGSPTLGLTAVCQHHTISQPHHTVLVFIECNTHRGSLTN